MFRVPNEYRYDELYVDDTMLDPRYRFIAGDVVELVRSIVQSPCLLAVHGVDTHFTRMSIGDMQPEYIMLSALVQGPHDCGALLNLRPVMAKPYSIHIDHIDGLCSRRTDLAASFVHRIKYREYVLVDGLRRNIQYMRDGKYHSVSSLGMDSRRMTAFYNSVIADGETRETAMALWTVIRNSRYEFHIETSDINECRVLSTVHVPSTGWSSIDPCLTGGSMSLLMTDQLYHIDLRTEGLFVKVGDGKPHGNGGSASMAIIDDDLVAGAMGREISIYSIKSGRFLKKVQDVHPIHDIAMAEWY